jgi:uncharacterized protein YutD
MVLRTRFNFQDGEMSTEQEQVCNLEENIYIHCSLGTVILAYITLHRIIYTSVKYTSVILPTARQIYVCSTQLPVYQRMNANGVLLPNDLFS